MTSENKGESLRNRELVREGHGSPYVVVVTDIGELISDQSQTDAFQGPPYCTGSVQTWSVNVDDESIQVWHLVIPTGKRRLRLSAARELSQVIGWYQEIAILAGASSASRELRPYKLSPELTRDFGHKRLRRLRSSSYAGWPIQAVQARVQIKKWTSNDVCKAMRRAVGKTMDKEVGNNLVASLEKLKLHNNVIYLNLIANNQISGSEGVNFGVFEKDVATVMRQSRKRGKLDGELSRLISQLSENTGRLRKIAREQEGPISQQLASLTAPPTKKASVRKSSQKTGDSVMPNGKETPPAGGTNISGVTVTNSTATYVGTFHGNVTTILEKAGLDVEKDPLAGKLAQLATALDTAKPDLSAEARNTVGGDIEQFTREATGPKRKNTLKTYGDNIVSAVSGLLKYAGPIAKVVDEVLTLTGAV